MLRPSRILALVALVAVLTACGHKAVRLSDADARPAVATSIASPRDDLHEVAAAAAVRRDTFHRAVTYAAAVGHNMDLARWAQFQADERARREREAAARAPAPTSNSSDRHAGGHSDAWWHGVAICEQGGANDSYFGYFSYMDGSAGGKSWADQVAMGNRTIATFGDHAWAPRCVAAGYSAAPGG